MEQKMQQMDKVELENLDLQLHLDAKLRALEIACKYTKDPSKLFTEGVQTCSQTVQTDLQF